MLNKNHVVLILSTNEGSVLEMKANIVKFPFGKEKASTEDLTDEEIESIFLTVSSIEVVDKEANLRNDVKGIHIDKQVGKSFSVKEFKELVENFNEDVDVPFDFTIKELDYQVLAN